MKLPRNEALPVKHPGYILKQRYILQKRITLREASEQLGITKAELLAFIDKAAPLTDSLALKLESFTGVSRSFWVNCQRKYDKYYRKTEI